MATKQPKSSDLPDYLTREGAAVRVGFDAPGPKIDGTEVDHLVMREPTVADQLAVEGKSAMKAEVALFANLCGQAPESIEGLSLKQYGRLQEAYGSFLG